jgi:UDP-N-acetylglucosamine:LPS N-acetylglucosamine transferase
MRVADLIVSKPGHTFDEAIASELPLVSLPPPPGSEEIQYRLLDAWNVGRGVRTLDELAQVVGRLLADTVARSAMQHAARSRGRNAAAQSISRWVCAAIDTPAELAGEMAQ